MLVKFTDERLGAAALVGLPECFDTTMNGTGISICSARLDHRRIPLPLSVNNPGVKVQTNLDA